LSDHGDQDPAERLATALRRIAVGIERREAAAAQAALPPAPAAAIRQADDSPPIAGADLDVLIARLRAVLDGMPSAGDRDGHEPADHAPLD